MDPLREPGSPHLTPPSYGLPPLASDGVGIAHVMSPDLSGAAAMPRPVYTDDSRQQDLRIREQLRLEDDEKLITQRLLDEADLRRAAEAEREELIKEREQLLVETARLEQAELDRQHRLAQEQNEDGWLREYKERQVVEQRLHVMKCDRDLHESEADGREQIEREARIERKAIRDMEQTEWYHATRTSAYYELHRELDHEDRERRMHIDQLRTLDKERQMEFSLEWARQRKLWAEADTGGSPHRASGVPGDAPANASSATLGQDPPHAARDALIQRETEQMLAVQRVKELEQAALHNSAEIQSAGRFIGQPRVHSPSAQQSPYMGPHGMQGGDMSFSLLQPTPASAHLQPPSVSMMSPTRDMAASGSVVLELPGGHMHTTLQTVSEVPHNTTTNPMEFTYDEYIDDDGHFSPMKAFKNQKVERRQIVIPTQPPHPADQAARRAESMLQWSERVRIKEAPLRHHHGIPEPAMEQQGAPRSYTEECFIPERRDLRRDEAEVVSRRHASISPISRGYLRRQETAAAAAAATPQHLASATSIPSPPMPHHSSAVEAARFAGGGGGATTTPAALHSPVRSPHSRRGGGIGGGGGSPPVAPTRLPPGGGGMAHMQQMQQQRMRSPPQAARGESPKRQPSPPAHPAVRADPAVFVQSLLQPSFEKLRVDMGTSVASALQLPVPSGVAPGVGGVELPAGGGGGGGVPLVPAAVTPPELIHEVVAEIKKLAEERDSEKHRVEELSRELASSQTEMERVLSEIRRSHESQVEAQGDDLRRKVGSMNALKADRERAQQETAYLRQQLDHAVAESNQLRDELLCRSSVSTAGGAAGLPPHAVPFPVPVQVQPLGVGDVPLSSPVRAAAPVAAAAAAKPLFTVPSFLPTSVQSNALNELLKPSVTTSLRSRVNSLTEEVRVSPPRQHGEYSPKVDALMSQLRNTQREMEALKDRPGEVHGFDTRGFYDHPSTSTADTLDGSNVLQTSALHKMRNIPSGEDTETDRRRGRGDFAFGSSTPRFSRVTSSRKDRNLLVTQVHEQFPDKRKVLRKRAETPQRTQHAGLHKPGAGGGAISEELARARQRTSDVLRLTDPTQRQ